MKRSPNWRYIGLLTLVVVLFYWKTLLTNQYTLINGSEGVNTTYAWLHFLVRSVWSGQVPLWDPYAFAGSPFAGALLPSAFYPMHLLFALVPLNKDGMISPRLYDEYMALVHLVGACFMFALLREMGRSRYASFVGACVFSLGGLVAKMMWPFYVEACIWLPAVFFFLLRAFRSDRRDRALLEAAGAGACLGMSILTGGMSFFIMEAIFLVAAVIWYALVSPERVRDQGDKRAQHWIHMSLILAVGVAVAAGLGAVQLLPANEYGKASLRFIDGGTLPSAQKIPYERMVPGMYPQSIVAGLFPAGFEGKIGGEETFPYYVGVLPLLLALIGIWKCWANIWVRYLTGLAVLAFLYSLGEFSPLNGVLYAVVPMLWVTRAANRFLFLTGFALSVLCAFGLDVIFDTESRRQSWTSVTRILKWVAVAAGAALVLPAFITTINVGTWNALSLLLIIGSCGLFFWMTRHGTSPAERVIVVAFILFDLSAFNWLEVAKTPGDQLDQMISLHAPVEFVKARAGLRRVRVAVEPEPNAGDVYGVQGMWGGWPTTLAGYSQLGTRDDLLNVGYVIRPASATDPGPVYQDARWKVYANPGSFPRAWVVHQVISAPTHDAAFALLNQPGLDLHSTAITERPMAFGGASQGGDSVRFRAYDESGMAFDVRAASPGLLMLSEMYYPGWRATVNGKAAEILRVDGALRGIQVAAGASKVELEFVSGSFYAGAFISLLTVVCVLAGWLYSRRRGKGTGAASRFYPAIEAGLPFLLFLFLAGDGILEFFGGDDVMNLFTYLSQPIAHWTLGAIEFWSSAWYRPLGGIVYLTLFRSFGFNAFPFKLFLFAALCLNLFLYFRLARRLSGSIQIASWALLFCSYNAALDGLYLDFGTIYDILGYSCYISALLIYAAWVCARHRRIAGISVIALYIAGLDFKEIDVTLPAVLLAYNLLLTDSLRTERRSWLWKSGLPILVCSALGAVYTIGKLTGPATLASQAAYSPHITLHQFAATSAHYIRHLFYLGDNYPTNNGALSIMALAVVAAFLLRSRLLIFAAVAAIVSQLPVAFIAARGAFVVYIPVAFWSLYLAGMVNAVRPVFRNRTRAFACFLVAAAALAAIHLRMKPWYDPNYTVQAAAYSDFSEQLDKWRLHPGPASRVLLVNDPFRQDWIGWDPLFIVNVRSATTGIVLTRMKFMTSVIPLSEIASYDYVIDYRDGWQLLKTPRSSSAIAAARMTAIADTAPVLLLDGFDPPTQAGWRLMKPEAKIRVKTGDAGAHKLTVSLSVSSLAHLWFRVDNGTVTDGGVHGPGNFEFFIPVSANRVDQPYIITLGIDEARDKRNSPQLLFISAQLSSA